MHAARRASVRRPRRNAATLVPAAASSSRTQQRLGWNPAIPTSIADLAAMQYRSPFAADVSVGENSVITTVITPLADGETDPTGGWNSAEPSPEILRILSGDPQFRTVR